MYPLAINISSVTITQKLPHFESNINISQTHLMFNTQKFTDVPTYCVSFHFSSLFIILIAF